MTIPTPSRHADEEFPQPRSDHPDGCVGNTGDHASVQFSGADAGRAEDNEGVSKFKILSIDEDGHALIESLLDSPGKYAFSVAVKFLVPA
ncbi:hypothetical protein [Rhodococcus jostii]|uniref:hypothetical protein n=1 Tax=Rhodococcus jostii TaxID=132919 RepID=UPI0036572FEF